MELSAPGIAPSDQGKIFEEFQQADNSATKRSTRYSKWLQSCDENNRLHIVT
jgi:hypothetical protein